MPSSPAETEAALAAIVADYDAALLAVEADDQDALDARLDAVERALAGLAEAPGEPARALLAQAQVRHRELCERVARARAGLAAALEHVRAGRRALAGYASGTDRTGARLDRDA